MDARIEKLKLELRRVTIEEAEKSLSRRLGITDKTILICGYWVMESRGKSGPFYLKVDEALMEAKSRILRGENVVIIPNLK